MEKDTGLLTSDLTPKDDIMSALFVRGNEPTKISTKYQKLEAPKNLEAKYNKDNQTITLTWDYDQKDNISFEISEKFNGQFQPLAHTADHKIDINNLMPGQTYEFSVVAMYINPDDESKNKNSDPATVTIQIPGQDNNQWPPNGPKDNKKCDKHPDDPKCGPVEPPNPPTDSGNTNDGGNGGDGGDGGGSILDLMP